MRWFALGCAIFVMGAWFGFHEARAAGDVKYDFFLLGKDTSKLTDDNLMWYTAGTYDMISYATYIANTAPKSFVPEVFTKQFQCLQKFQKSGEMAAWAKDYWKKEPNYVAADALFNHACEDSSARANAMMKSSGRGRSTGGQHTITLR